MVDDPVELGVRRAFPERVRTRSREGDEPAPGEDVGGRGDRVPDGLFRRHERGRSDHVQVFADDGFGIHGAGDTEVDDPWPQR